MDSNATDNAASSTFTRRDVLSAAGALGALSALPLPVAAATGANPGHAAMMQVFEGFLDSLRRAAASAFATSLSQRPIDLAGGLRHILDNIALGMSLNLHHTDTMNPELVHYMDPTRKQGGDNQDALYLGANLDGSQTYRIHGNRGSARFFAVTVIAKGPTPWGGASTAFLFGRDMQVADDGSFEIVLSPQAHPGNWLQIGPDTLRVTIRQFFADWETERPMRAMIERIGAPVAPALMTPERVTAGITATGAWIEQSITFWQHMMGLFARTPNRFQRWRELDTSKVDATPGGEPLLCYWSVPEDSALIIRVMPPKCEYWNIEFNNPWWETHDYRQRLSGTNLHHAVLEQDGEIIAVIAHDDPGVPNWLDPGGFTEGMMGLRWMFAESTPFPQTRLVKRAELARELPPGVKTFTAAQRQEQLAGRRRGIYRRFHWF
jgi:hypothetical protein